jgi:hypothetical protein
MAAESALALRLAPDSALDFAPSQANIPQLAIAQGFELKNCRALDAPIQESQPPRLQTDHELADELIGQLIGAGCDALQPSRRVGMLSHDVLRHRILLIPAQVRTA